MGVAEYAVERNRMMADNISKAIQMMMGLKQYREEKDWRNKEFEYNKGERNREFDYRQGQDVINQSQQERALQRQAAAEQRQQEHGMTLEKHYANMDAVRANPPVKPEGPSDVYTKTQEAAKLGLKGTERNIYIYGAAGKPDKPESVKPGSLELERQEFIKAGKEAGLGSEQITQAWYNHLKGNTGIFDDLDAPDVSPQGSAPPEPVVAPPGLKEGDRVRNKKTGAVGIVRGGFIVPSGK